jgi:subtilisin family serine protease
MMSLLDDRPQARAFPPALGHGTIVAGLIHLVAPQARIVPIRAFDANGDTTMFTLIEAVYRAKEQNVDVLNMSFSTKENSEAFRKAIHSALADGIAVVASVGNDSRNAELYPAAYPGVVGVAATDFGDRLASFSNYGKSVSIAAPGAFVISTAPGGRYAAAWGTSFSAPIASGVLALRATSKGNMHSDVAAVLNNADFVDHLKPGFEKQLGKGRVNAHRALTRK